MKKRLFSLLLACLSLSLLLTSCAGSSLFRVMGSEISDFAALSTQLLSGNTPLARDGVAYYTLAADEGLSPNVTDKIDALLMAVKEKTGADLTASEGARGKLYITTSPVGDADTATLSAADYHIGFVGDDLVIRAASEAVLAVAVARFTEDFVLADNRNTANGAIYLSMKKTYAAERLRVCNGMNTDYVIVRAADATDAANAAATELQKALVSASGIQIQNMSLVTDTAEGLGDKHLIVVGKTALPESAALSDALLPREFSFTEQDGNFYISAQNDTVLEQAVAQFAELFLYADNADADRSAGTLYLPAGLSYHSTPHLLTLADALCSDYTVIYPAKASAYVKEQLELFLVAFAAYTNVTLTAKSDAEVPATEGAHEILFGDTNREASATVKAERGQNRWLIRAVDESIVISYRYNSHAYQARAALQQLLLQQCRILNEEWNDRTPEDEILLFLAPSLRLAS